MNERKLVSCPRCGWVHFVASPEEFGGAPRESCFRCGYSVYSCTPFHPATGEQVPRGSTIQAIFLPEQK